MKLTSDVLHELRVGSSGPAHLASRSTSNVAANWLKDLDQSEPGAHATGAKELAEQDLREFVQELAVAQELLWANGTRAILVVLQAMDAAGKDGTIKHVMSGVNPQGCRVEAFKQPSSEETRHDFLWRCTKVLPELGEISIFNRSYYEDVLVTRVHPELLERTRERPAHKDEAKFWRHRYEDINAFEHHLHRNGTRLVKVFLHLSRDEQKRRFLDRLNNPGKEWKFSTADLAEREHWNEYQVAYEEALSATSTSWAPWYVVPADHKYALRALVGGLIVHTIDQLNLHAPTVSEQEHVALAAARESLLAET
jgi:PPK2 family polyphosphate:nucleotide phosphotransferase